MSINAVNGVSQSIRQQSQPQATTPSPTVTPFSQQLDAETAKAGGHGHHHHHGGGGSQSVTSSPAAAASASGGGAIGLLASSVLKLLH